jgi:uncharacterized metal-binding protein
MGARVEPLMALAKQDRLVLCVDGCPTRCASRVLEQAGIRPDRSLVVTELGITKNGEMRYRSRDALRVRQAILRMLG